jgi:protein-S-isoprenylcysteine O-methyltransferase Ste14
MLAMHGIILGEERYCTETYGDEYLNYKKQVARYF